MHALDETTGTAAIAYVGEVPWHGLGTALKRGADLETWERAAGFGFDLKRAQVRFATGPAVNAAIAAGGLIPTRGLRAVDDKVVLFRDDTQAPLSVVSARYKVVQPREVLSSMHELAESAGLHLETAGLLFDGARYWALATTDDALDIEDMNLLGQDRVKPYLLLASSCDGSMPTNARWTTVRVVCNNTITMAGVYKRASQGDGVFRLSHRSVFRPEEAFNMLGVDRFREQWGAFKAATLLLARTKVTARQVEETVEALLRTKRAPVEVVAGGVDAEEREPRRPRGLDRIMDLFNGAGKGADLDTARGTAWGAVNAVTQFVDWEGGSRTPDGRLHAAWFGSGDALKTEALRRFLALAE